MGTNLNINTNTAQRRAFRLGPELHTNANAASDPNGNEADAITGFTDNVNFISQNSIVSTGSYALLAESNTTPISGGRFFVDLEAAPFNCVNGKTYRLSYSVRHVGTGGQWNAYLNSTSSSTENLISECDNTDIVFTGIVFEWTHDATHKFFSIREVNTPNDGGVYFDNFSVRERL